MRDGIGSFEARGNLQIEIVIDNEENSHTVERIVIKCVDRTNKPGYDGKLIPGPKVISSYTDFAQCTYDMRQYAEFLHDMADKIDTMVQVKKI